jgi:transglutaminase-like putative cysteine protease
LSDGDPSRTGGSALITDSLRAVLRLFTQRNFDGGQPGADCLTPQLRTNGRLAANPERNLPGPPLSSSLCHVRQRQKTERVRRESNVHSERRSALATLQLLAHHHAMRRVVGAEIEVEITAPTTLEFQIAVARYPRAEVFESLDFVLNGRPVQPVEVSGLHGSRIHKFDAAEGILKVDYAATIVGQADPAPITEHDLSMYLRPSRYAEADKFYGFAATEFATYGDSATLLENVSSWVGTRLNYVPGSSDPIDGAVDTLLAGEGVCRDYAHLVVALLRAVNVPARLVSVYAPGVYPMDFHAVAEAFVEGHWRVVDATLLAPRQTLVRIATGRDAADTAFLDNHKGQIQLNRLVVTAVVDGDLPTDSIDQLVSIR